MPRSLPGSSFDQPRRLSIPPKRRRKGSTTAAPPSAFQASRTARWASNGGTAAPGSNEHTIALQVDHLFGFRDRELDRIVSVLMRISPNEAVLFHAVRGVSLDDPSGLILTICSVGGRPDAVALVFDGRCDRRVGFANFSSRRQAAPRCSNFREHL
jgi:hypothetical protein